jgi:protein-disulfide isomerase
MKRFKNKDLSFIALAGAAAVLCICYACATTTDPRFIGIRTLASKIDLSELTPTESKRLERVLNTQTSPCGDDVTLAESLFNPRHCPLAPFAGNFVVDQIKQDYNEQEIAAAYLARYAKLKGLQIPVDGSPEKGAKNPVVTFVVFTDFQCPFCAKAAEKLDEIVRSRPDEVAIIFKNFPLTTLHPEAELAARAAFAAGVQDKFWEMHDVLFSASRTELTRERIDTFAEGLGLDMEKFEEDISSTAATAAIENDKKLGESLGVKVTPTIFINGRLIGNGYKGIDSRLYEELLRAGKLETDQK